VPEYGAHHVSELRTNAVGLFVEPLLYLKRLDVLRHTVIPMRKVVALARGPHCSVTIDDIVSPPCSVPFVVGDPLKKLTIAAAAAPELPLTCVAIELVIP